jgi:hypothetical protein
MYGGCRLGCGQIALGNPLAVKEKILIELVASEVGLSERVTARSAPGLRVSCLAGRFSPLGDCVVSAVGIEPTTY